MADKEKQEIKRPNAIVRFYRDTMGELRKVNWPTFKDALRLTGIVVIVMVVMALVLGAFDYLGSTLVTLAIGAK